MCLGFTLVRTISDIEYDIGLGVSMQPEQPYACSRFIRISALNRKI